MKTKEEILQEVANKHSYDTWVYLMYDSRPYDQMLMTFEAMEEYKNQSEKVNDICALCEKEFKAEIVTRVCPECSGWIPNHIANPGTQEYKEECIYNDGFEAGMKQGLSFTSKKKSIRVYLAEDYANKIIPNANANDAPYITTGDVYDYVKEAYIQGAQSTSKEKEENGCEHKNGTVTTYACIDCGAYRG